MNLKHLRWCIPPENFNTCGNVTRKRDSGCTRESGSLNESKSASNRISKSRHPPRVTSRQANTVLSQNTFETSSHINSQVASTNSLRTQTREIPQQARKETRRRKEGKQAHAANKHLSKHKGKNRTENKHTDQHSRRREIERCHSWIARLQPKKQKITKGGGGRERERLFVLQ